MRVTLETSQTGTDNCTDRIIILIVQAVDMLEWSLAGQRVRNFFTLSGWHPCCSHDARCGIVPMHATFSY